MPGPAAGWRTARRTAHGVHVDPVTGAQTIVTHSGLLSDDGDIAVVPGDPGPLPPMPIAFQGEVFRYTVTGGEPSGLYRWIGGLAEPGTLVAVGSIDQDAFAVNP
jgi:hypothetical protein